MQKKSFKINGMTCSACANRVERVVGKLDGVEKSNVNFATETLSVEFDENKLQDKDIEEKVVKAGYSIKKNIKTYNLKVEGMTCSACANRVERVTKKIGGVQESNVNFATEKLTIVIDEDVTGYSDIKTAVEKSGYKLEKEDKVKAKEDKKESNPAKELLNRFIISVILTVPLLIISMGHMVGMHLPSIIDPMINPLNFALIQIALTLPVMLVGYKFYKVGITVSIHI